MKRDLALEVRKFQQKLLSDSFPQAISIYNGTIGGGTPPTPEVFGTEVVTAPAIAAVRNLTRSPLVANTLQLIRISDSFEYTRGVDFTENATLGRFTNLTITPNQSLRANYWYRSVSGSSMSAAQILAALLNVDGTGSQLDADRLDGLDAAAFALVAHNHDATYIPLTALGSTVANLVGGKLPTAYLPSLALNEVYTVATQAAMLALPDVDRGDMAIRTDLGATFVLAADDQSVLANWVRLPTAVDAVISVNGQTGIVVLDAHDVGAYLQSEVYSKVAMDAILNNMDQQSGFHYATLVKYGL